MDSDSVQGIDRLKILLDDTGYIKSIEDAINLTQIMEKMTSVAGRSLVINILHATASNSQNKNYDILLRFLNEGGWNMLGLWFQDSLESKHLTLLTEIIQALSIFPITIELLKSSSIPKSLKKVAKIDFKPVQLASKRLLISWKKYVRDKNSEKLKKSDKDKPKTPTFLDTLSAAITQDSNRKRRINCIVPEKKSPILETIDENTSIITYEEPLETLNIDSSKLKETTPRKRRVSFREDSLVEIFYFEMTEQERLEMHGERRSLQFDEARHLECLEEKNAIQNARMSNINIEQTKDWIKTSTIDDITHCIRGYQSEEKEEQIKRESDILPPIYVKEELIPDTFTSPPLIDFANEEIETDKSPEKLESGFCLPYWNNYAFPLPQIRNHFLQPNQDEYYHARNPNQHPNYPMRFPPRRGGMQRHLYPPNFSNPEKIYRPQYSTFENQRFITPSDFQTRPTRLPSSKISLNLYELVCRHFMKGNCQLGNTCRFSHDPSNVS